MDTREPAAHGAAAGPGIAASMLTNVSSLAEDMLEYLAERIPEVGADDELRGLTLGSCSSNIEAALSMFRHGIDVAAAQAPVTALEHARAMASRGHSVDVMLRFYRLGHEYFTEKLSDALAEGVGDPNVALRTFADLERFGFRYIDRISSLVAAEYVAELDRRQNQARVERDDVVRALLAGERIDNARAERMLSHRLTGRQIGFVCWTADRDVDLDRLARRVGRYLGASHSLVVADGPLAVWAWAPITGDVQSSLTSMATDLPGEHDNVHIAVGSPHLGPAGFRASHLEAIRTRRVIELSGRAAPSITAFTDVALVDVISQDLDAARAFVADQLGDLARDDAKERGERAALLAVLDAQGSLTTAARTLGIHKNTVLQRMRRAEERRGRPATVKIAELHAALLVCSVLGNAVLPDSSPH
ncbi:helix-turn-helix domain-containing protein [Mycobacterium hackensackense]|uniref:PucR family transcriptional regulator n=1 Tax=Mycobacterium hackensackense TaxID=228909 RepID=UPI0022659F27|nr:helix-turn-helix domain-containing protein [Mycobacterium hackensackense]MCV7252322.1 helix-turn-helix domain-containing protein [Mycobacterium hackensackense]